MPARSQRAVSTLQGQAERTVSRSKQSLPAAPLPCLLALPEQTKPNKQKVLELCRPLSSGLHLWHCILQAGTLQLCLAHTVHKRGHRAPTHPWPQSHWPHTR